MEGNTKIHEVFGRYVPRENVILQRGYYKTIDRIKGIIGKILSINPELKANEFDHIFQTIRHEIYKMGLADGYEQLQKTAVDESTWEQKEIDHLYYGEVQESGEEFFQGRVKLWRTYFCLRALSFLEEEREQAFLLGKLRARFRPGPSPGRIPAHYLSEDGKDLIRKIDMMTPLDELLDIIYFTDENRFEIFETDELKFNRNLLQAMRKQAHNCLIKHLIGSDQDILNIGTKYFTFYHYDEILKRSPDALSEGQIGRKASGIIQAYAILREDSPEFDRKFVLKKNLAKVNPYELERAMKIMESWPKLEQDEKDRKINEYLAAKELIENAATIGLKRLNDILRDSLQENESYFVGSFVFYNLIQSNQELLAVLTVYKHMEGSDEEKETNGNGYNERLNKAKIPDHLKRQLETLFNEKLKGRPFIVRSSSTMEDQKNASFAGLYESIICFGEDFDEFFRAVSSVYSSVYTPKVLNYRKKLNLLDMEENMGLLIQQLNGDWYGDYLLPDIAGVSLSHAPDSHGPDPADGMMTVVHGLGELVVNKGGKIILYNKPNSDPYLGSRYSQDTIVVLNRKSGKVEEISIREFLKNAPIHNSKTLKDIYSHIDMDPITTKFSFKPDKAHVSFEGLTKSSNPALPLIMEYYTKRLKEAYGGEVDVEFTAVKSGNKYKVKIVQCRYDHVPDTLKPARIPENLGPKQILIQNNESLSSGFATDIEYMLYIPMECYDESNPDSLTWQEFQALRQWIYQINKNMKAKNYIIVSPGRFGDNIDSELGVFVRSNDYDNTAAIVETVGRGKFKVAPSAGTHDYRLIKEKGIATLSVDAGRTIENIGDPKKADHIFSEEILNAVPNRITRFLDGNKTEDDIPDKILKYVKVISARDLGTEVLGKTRDWRFQVAMNNRQLKPGDPRMATVYFSQKGKNLPQVGNI